MAHLICFRTDRFDVTSETPNEFNAYAGESLLKWLRGELAKNHYRSTEPETEDWGWYIDLEGADAKYLVGATAEVEYKEEANEDAPLTYDVAANAVLDWTVQIQKHRTIIEKLLGKNRMAADDALCALIERIVRSERTINGVTATRSAV